MSVNPYDTGTRLEPRTWVTSTAGLTRDNADDYGKVDFDNEEGSTQLTVWAEPGEDGLVVLHARTFDNRIRIKWEG